MAASLSYYTIFSLAPLLILIIGAGGLLLGHKAAQGEIMNQLEGLIGHNGAAAIQSMVEAASKPKRNHRGDHRRRYPAFRGHRSAVGA
jgi:membrane protein